MIDPVWLVVSVLPEGEAERVDLASLLSRQGEVQFLFNEKSYLMAAYSTKKLFRQRTVEYCLFPPADTTEPIQRFDTLEGLMQAEIDGHKLIDLLDDISLL